MTNAFSTSRADSFRCTSWAAALLLACPGLFGCKFSLDGLTAPAPAEPDSSADGSPDDDAGHTPDAGGSRDAGTRDAGADAGGDHPGGVVRHEKCLQPLSEVREPKDIAVDATGRPLFDLYRDLSCAGAAEPQLCQGNEDCGARNSCLESADNRGGVCLLADDTPRFVLTLEQGQCFASASLAAHARACCETLPGFDCRAWPYPHDSAPGELCARAADCEPGLVCSPYLLEGFGLCVCPGDEASEYSGC